MITLAGARRTIEAAEHKAADIGQPMNIAVVDGGNLLATFAWTTRGLAASASLSGKRGPPAPSRSRPTARRA